MDQEVRHFTNECALRFDYHPWVDAGEGRDSEADEYSDRCIEARELLEADVLLKMASLYQLQRALRKWGLVREPDESPFYWVFYELVLDLYDKDVPPQWRRADSRWGEFEDRAARAAQVRTWHDSIEYDWARLV